MHASSQSSSQKMQRRRGSGGFVLKLLFWLVAVFFALQFVVNHSFTHRYLERLINNALEQELGLSLRVGKMQLQAFPPRLELITAELSSQGHKVLTVNHAAAAVSLRSLLLGRFQLSQITLNHVLVHHWASSEFLPQLKKYQKLWQQREDAVERDPLLEEMESSSYVFSWDHLVKRISLHHGSFERVGFRHRGFALDFTDFDLTVDLQGLRRGEGSLEVWGVRLQDEIFSYVEGARVSAQVSWEEDGAEITSLILEDSRWSFEARMKAGEQLSLERGQLDLSADVKGDLSVVGLLLDVGDNLGMVQGNLSGKVGWGESLQLQLALEGDMQVSSGSLFGFQLFDSNLRLGISAHQLRFSEVLIQEAGTLYAEAEGFVDLDDAMEMSFAVEPRQLSLSQIFEIVRVSAESIEARISGADPILLYGRGDPFELHITGHHTFENLHISSLEPGAEYEGLSYPRCLVEYRWLVNMDSLYFDTSKGSCGSQSSAELQDELSFEGTLSFEDELDLNIEVRSLDLSSYSKLVHTAVSGEGEVAVNIGGTYDKTVLDIEGSSPALTLFDLPLGEVKASLQLAVHQDTLWLRSIHSRPAQEYWLADRGAVLQLRAGHYNYLRDELRLVLAGRRVAGSFVKKILQRFTTDDVPFTASLDHFDVEMLIPLRRPDDLSITAQFEAQDLYWHEEKLLHSLRGRLNLKDQQLQLQQAVVDPSGVWPWRIDGWWRVAPERSLLSDLLRGDARFAAYGFSLPTTEDVKLAALPVVGPALGAVGLSGPWHISAELHGTLARPTGEVKAVGSKSMLLGAPLPLEFKLQLDEGEARYSLVGKGDKVRVVGEASFTGGTFELQGDLLSLNILPYLRSLLPEGVLADARSYLYISSGLQLQGAFTDLGSWRGSWQLSKAHGFSASGSSFEASLEEQGWDVILRRPSRLSFEQGRLSLDHDLVFFGDGAEWVVGLQPQSTLKRGGFSLRASYDLGVLPRLLQFVSASRGMGLLEGELWWKGEKWDYGLRARSKADDRATVVVRDLSPPLKNLSYDMTLDSGGVEVRDFTAFQGPGTIKVQGRLPWDTDKAHGGLDVALRRVMIQVDSAVLGPVVMQLGGDLKLVGSSFPFTLRGDVDVQRALSMRPLRVLQDILDEGNVSIRRGWGESGDAALLLDVNVHAPATLLVQNDPLDLVLTADLHLSGNVEYPEISGYLEIPRGKVFYKREYEIIEGSVIFDESTTWDPLLDIKARTEIDDYRIDVALRGRSQDPRMDFSVDPAVRDNGEPLSRFEVLFLMFNGHLPAQDVSWDRQQDILISESFNLAFRVVNQELSEITELLEQSVIENISILAYASARTGSTMLRAVAPLNTGQEDVDVTLHVDPDSLGIKAEYELDPGVATSLSYNKNLTGDSGEEGVLSEGEETSVGLRFRFSFP